MSCREFTGQFYTPCLVVENITSNKDVTVMDKISIGPGECIDVFKAVVRYSIPEDEILYHLSIPYGDLYNEVVIKKSLRILYMELPGAHYSIVHPFNLSVGDECPAVPGSWPVAVDDNDFKWITPRYPLEIENCELVIPPASSTQDGYLTKEDYQLFYSSIGDLCIWQYQDFAAPAASSLTITAFENGTGLAFDSSLIQNGTASIVLTSDTEQPPTSTTSVPAKYLPGSRVEVSSHIGTTVVLNQAPAASLPVRVYFQVCLPPGTKHPSGYIEDPNFVNERELDYLDDFLVNQAGDETIYDVKTFDSQAIFTNSIQIPLNPYDGYILTSDASGNATWLPNAGGASAGDHGSLSGLGDDDHLQYGLLAGDSSRNTVTGTYNFTDGYLTAPVSSVAPTFNLVEGSLTVVDGILYVYDSARAKWLSQLNITTSAARTSNNATNIYLRGPDGVATNIAPFVLPWDATLVAMTASARDSNTWTAEVRVGGTLVTGASLSIVASTTATNSTLNVDFSAGDGVQTYLNGSGIRQPRVNLVFARRI